MEKVVRIVKKGQDESNLQFWITTSEVERLFALEKTRQEINHQQYGFGQQFQRVYRVVKRTSS
jgi:hypothetical protein